MYCILLYKVLYARYCVKVICQLRCDALPGSENKLVGGGMTDNCLVHVHTLCTEYVCIQWACEMTSRGMRIDVEWSYTIPYHNHTIPYHTIHLSTYLLVLHLLITYYS
jgi:hypothetical protein